MNIALIGMMGSGKSTVAKILANRLKDFSFVDTDEKIVTSQKMSINEIFEKYGEKAFRAIETLQLREVLKKDNQIIATGGGIVISEENLSELLNNSILIYLKADAGELYNRVKNDNERPLLNDCNIKEKIINLLSQRENKYNKAHFTIDTTNKTPDIIVKEILEKIYGKNRS